jgi:hypothetical protein
MAAAWSRYVLFGSGALCAFCASAAQHFVSELAELEFLGAVALGSVEGAGGSGSWNSEAVGGGTGANVALGRGGTSSSLLQPWQPGRRDDKSARHDTARIRFTSRSLSRTSRKTS